MRQLALLVLSTAALNASVHAQQRGPDAPWPAPVPGFVPPQPGEHPRLFFRKADLPKLKQRAQTPEGKAIIERCKWLLDGATAVRGPGKFTLWDGAAFGFLYQMTGEKRYADLARTCMDRIWEGAIDRDNRYSLVPPNEPMRAGPSLSAVAMAYDLCYDAWDPAYRKEQAQKMFTWKGKCKKRGGEVSLERLSLNPDNPNPVSNHFALQVGGAGLTVLALAGDPELSAEQQQKLIEYQKGVDRHARKVMTEDFGEGGYFGEHAGPGVIAMTWTFTPWLLAEKVCAGRDWVTPRPNGEWMSLRFVMQTIPTAKGPMYTNPTAGRGGYGGDFLEQAGGHHSTYFCQGFGAIQPHRKAAMLWVYQNFVEPTEHQLYPNDLPAGQKSYDVFSYPHRAMFALVNWPFGVTPENPEKTLPKVAEDRRMGQYIFRNRWKDKDDIIVAVLFGSRTTDRLRRMMVWGLGQQMTFGTITPAVEGSAKINKARIDFFQPAEDGSGVVSAGGNCVAVDYSGAAGCDAVIVMVGPGATGQLGGSADKIRSQVQNVEAGGRKFSILTLTSTGQHPKAVVAGDKIALGGQTISHDGTKVVFGKMAGPPKIQQ